MLLAVDIGNTHTVIGLFRKTDILACWRLQTCRHATADDLAVVLHGLFAARRLSLDLINKVIIGSVVPALKKSWRDLARQYTGSFPVEVGPHLDTGITIATRNPEEVGADRIINCVAGYNLYRQALIIIDFGTAITFDCITGQAEYLGGAIAPGLKVTSDALARKAAKLPRVDLSTFPSRTIGDSTETALQSGFIYGFTGLVEGMVKRLSREFSEQPKVIATGGQVEVIASCTSIVDSLEPMLTLTGLQILYARNS
ncbi:MAG: type III pantothenate kinase [Thermodesulfobacteriota bacterium]